MEVRDRLCISLDMGPNRTLISKRRAEAACGNRVLAFQGTTVCARPGNAKGKNEYVNACIFDVE